MKEGNRRTGRTTRQVDNWVQEIFTYGECKVYDHFCNEVDHKNRDKRTEINKRSFKILQKRMAIEHQVKIEMVIPEQNDSPNREMGVIIARIKK